MFRVAVGVALMFASIASAAEWKLIWGDEFDKPGLPDPAKWGYEVGFIRNREEQYYTDARGENVRVEDGMLVIEGRKERFKNRDYRPGSPGRGGGGFRRSKEFAEYTSGSINTLGKASWQYGRVEVRAKMPKGRGVWPAIWMMGDDRPKVGWPRCGEIDIMEFVGMAPGVVHANVHGPDLHTGGKTKVEDASEAFHVYAVEWFEDRMDFYVDERKYWSRRKDDPGNKSWPFDKPHYLLLNLAVGGEWGGQKGIDEAVFPQKYLIDYVRVYQKK
jgi:beta-glucanase (GH16 family)